MANRILVRWEKKIENRIAPPGTSGWCCDRLEELQIEGVGRIYWFDESLSITVPKAGFEPARVSPPPPQGTVVCRGFAVRAASIGIPMCRIQTRANFNSPSVSITVVILSPALSHTCFSGGMPPITPSGVPVKNMSPGFKVKCCDA